MRPGRAYGTQPGARRACARDREHPRRRDRNGRAGVAHRRAPRCAARSVQPPAAMLPAADRPAHRRPAGALRPDQRQAGHPGRQHRAQPPPLPGQTAPPPGHRRPDRRRSSRGTLNSGPAPLPRGAATDRPDTTITRHQPAREITMNANDATFTELTTAHTGSTVEDNAPNAPADASFDLVIEAVAGTAVGNSGAPYTLTVSAIDLTAVGQPWPPQVLTQAFNPAAGWKLSGAGPDYRYTHTIPIAVP